jgi:hypothetical protein
MHKVTDLVGHESEQELFRIGRGFTYQSLQKIIHQNIPRFNEMDEKYFEDMILHALSNLNLQNTFTPQNDLMQQILQNQQQMLHQLQNLEKSHKELHTKYNTLQTRTTTNFQQPLITLGPRLQKINPETLTLDKVYESVSECLNESLNTKQRLARPSIDKAITENTIYHGFRWAYVSRDKDPNIIHDLPPTKQTKIQNIGYIAKINQEKTEIIQVYIDRKTAATMNGYVSNSALDTPVKKQTLTNGFYYMLYDQCDEFLKQTYEEQYGEPLLYRDGVGQYDQEHQLLRTFIHKYDCMKQLKISDKTLAKALDKPITYNQCYYKTVGSKLVC